MNYSHSYYSSQYSNYYLSEHSIPSDVKAHACLMILAWGFCNPNAIIISRHFKKGWPGRTINDLAYWFQFHVVLQSFTLGFVLLALMIIVVHVMGYSTLNELPFSAHPPCGFTIIVLTFLNPIVAWFLCTTSGRQRAITKYIHQTAGILSQMLSIPTILIGLQMPALGSVVCSTRIYSALFIITVVLNVIIEVIFEIIGYKIRRNVQIVQSILSIGADEADTLLARFVEDPKRGAIFLDQYKSESVEQRSKRGIPMEITKNRTLWVIKYFLLAVHLALSFSLIFVLVVLLAA
ncbi:hypothetical protein MN116_001190 [Schistosoma mekongi]|uniref:ascorbate ferrireductase (transmembrane) n=1 Tax=Schistosoma mekongi TaxID=38744 RepID=A0AAE1ZKR5_SCHME|nr:hypothetical protein MN116_001190 [Schistosoma mekongi]